MLHLSLDKKKKRCSSFSQTSILPFWEVSTFVFRIKVSEILLYLMLTLTVVIVPSLNGLRWAMQPVQILVYSMESMPVPVAERSKARVYGRSLAGIAGSNPAGAWMVVRCECCVCC